MPTFNPAVPVHASLIASDELRDNFNALKGLIDAPPALATLKSGSGNLDGSGELDMSGIITSGYFVAMFNDVTGVGPLTFQSAPYRIVSAAGAADAGKGVVWVAF